jgi:polyisoprenoid-binding protein YceI
MVTWKGILAIATVVVAPPAASAEERVLILEPERTSVTFTVKATGHDVDGVLALQSGQIRFDPDTGAVSGQVTLDLRRAQTGNRLRDREMRQNVFETERFPHVVFRPSRMLGALQPSAVSDIVLVGVVVMHGTEHAFSLPVKARLDGESVSAEAVFDIPYVAWGMRNPSLLFLRVAPAVAVTVKTEASLRSEGGSR